MDTFKNQQQNTIPILKEHKLLELDQRFICLQ